MDPYRTILCIDEPPMGSDKFPDKPEENPLAAATVPRVESLPTLVGSFLDRFHLPLDKRAEHVKECYSTELDRGVVLCDPSGALAFPHQSCKTATELEELCKRLPSTP